MDESKRRFMKLLPLAAVAVAGTVKAGNIEAEALEVNLGKKYVFRIRPRPDGYEMSQQNLDDCAKALRERGFKDFVVMQGDIDIFEMDS